MFKKMVIPVLVALLALPQAVLFASGTKEEAKPPVDGLKDFESDTFKIKNNDLKIFFLNHASMLLAYKGKFIHVDPVSTSADYSTLPAADLILVTHQHSDHLDAGAIAKIRKPDTILIADSNSAKSLEGAQIMQNEDKQTVLGIEIEAVPAYNTTAGRDIYHPKGRDNGYILNFDGFKVYIAGDTEDTPEMKTLKGIDVAFLPMNQPYTMVPEQVAAAAIAMQPAVLYPYHYGNTDINKLLELLKDEKNIEVRVHKMK